MAPFSNLVERVHELQWQLVVLSLLALLVLLLGRLLVDLLFPDKLKRGRGFPIRRATVTDRRRRRRLPEAKRERR